MGRGTRISVVLLVAISAPLAFASESLIRKLVLPPEFDEVRDFFGPGATSFAWGCVALCVLAAVFGIWVQRRWVRERTQRAREEGTDVGKAAMDRTFLSMSIPQVPAILSTVAYMSGSELTPVVVAMVISSVGVIAQGIQWEVLLADTRT